MESPWAFREAVQQWGAAGHLPGSAALDLRQNLVDHRVIGQDRPLGLDMAAAWHLWGEVDLIIGIGTHLEIPFMRWGSIVKAHRALPGRKLIRVDIDPAEMDKLDTEGPLVAIAGAGVRALEGALDAAGYVARGDFGKIAAAKARARYIALSSAVGGDDKPRDSGGERRFCEAPPGAGVDIGAYGPTISARRSRNGIKKLFGEAKREICRTSKRRARKLRKRVDHQKEADCNSHQQFSQFPTKFL